MSSIFLRFRALIARMSRKDVKGGAMVEFSMLIGLVAGTALLALTFFGEEVDYAMCRATNALGGVTGYINEDCYESPLTPEELGYDPEGFVDLYLYKSEIEKRRVLLPVKNFDIKGLSEVLVETDREDSVAACYRLEGGQVTCASMQGLASAFTFPPNVVAVGYEILPVQDPRIEMAQPVSITLGSIDNPALNKTWDITVFREPEANLFDPEMVFDNIEFPAGTVGEQRIIEALRGQFSEEELIFIIDPSAEPTLDQTGEADEPTAIEGEEGTNTDSETSGDKGAFGICSRGNPRAKVSCGLIQTAPSTTTIRPDGVSLGYEFFLPRDVRKPVSWPMTISLASSFEPEVKKIWEIVVSRVPGEAPSFHELPFTDIEFEADTASWAYSMVELDQAYTSDLLVKIPQSDPGLKACFQRSAGGGYSCSSDAGDGEVEFTVPAGAYSMGLGVKLPDDVLIPFERRAAFEVHSVDYPDHFKTFDLAITRPEFIVVFEPAIVFEDVEFPMGTTDWQTELVEMAGNFNSAQVLVLPEGQPNGGVCSQGSEEEPEAAVSCRQSDEDGSEVEVGVAYGAKQIGFAVNLGESEFQPVDEVITFEMRNAKDPSFMESYSVRVTRPATPIVFEPDTASMTFVDMAYPEASEGWQEPQLVPLEGTFNTDLLLKMAGGIADAGLCYQATPEADPKCGESALNSAQEWLVPNGSYAIGLRPRMSSDIHVEQDLPITFDLTSAEGGEGVVSFALRATRPAVPVKFDPNLGFRDKVFEKGLTEEQHVFVPIEGEITTGLKMIIPQTDFDLRACYVANAGDKPACLGPATYGEVVLDVPRESAAVGYRVMLPDDVHVDWAENVAFRVVSDYDETLDYEVAVAVSRETTPVLFAPSTAFDDVEFPAGTTGTQDVLEAMVGDITTKARVEIPAAGFAVQPCIQKASSASPSCGVDAADANQSLIAKWSKEEEEDGARFIYGAGYRVSLPDDIHQAFDKSFTLRLVSQYDPSKSRDYRIRVTRPAVEVLWRPDASLKLPDAEFPVRSTGARDVMIPFAGTFTTDTDYTMGQTQRAISPCFMQDEGGQVECGDDTASGISSVTLGSTFSGIGYRVDLPTDLAQEVDKTVQVDLRSAYDPNLASTQTFRVYREPAPVVFSPTVSFPDRVFEGAETGWQRDMERLSGEVTTDLELFAKAGIEIKLCVQEQAGEEPTCTTQSKGSDKILAVSPTAHSIGYAVRLPDDPSTEDRQNLSFELRMVEFPSQRQQYNVSTHRKSLEELGVTFKPSMSFGNQTLEIGEFGWFTFMEPLEGEFSTEIELVAQNADENLKLCTQPTEGGEISCSSVPASGVKTIDRSLHAIGYSVNVPDEEFVSFKRTVSLRLQPSDAPGAGQDFNPIVTRPERAVELPAAGFFASPKVFEEATAGYQDVMVELGGVGNTPMRFEMAAADFDVRPCIQLTAQSPVTCPAESAAYEAKSYAFDSDTYAIGYRVRLPQDPFDTFDRSVSMSVRSTTVEGNSRSYGVSLKRPVQMPVMPPEDMFTNRQYPPGTTGTKTIMAKLDPRIDTPLKFAKGSSNPDLALCYQRSQSGPVTCEGEGEHGSFEIIDTDQSWYAVGYRFTLDEDPDKDVFRTLPMRMTSTRVAEATVPYNVGISRMIMNAVMPDRTFFPDVTYEEGATGKKIEMQPIGDDVNIDLVLHKASGQPGLDLCYRTSSGSSIYCSGADTDGAHSISVSHSWYSIGYRFSVGDSKFSPFDETFNLHLTARDGWSNRVDYSIDASRPHTPMVLPAADMFTDVVFEEDQTGIQYVLAQLDPAVNTHISLDKPAGQPNLTMCRRQSEGSSLVCDVTKNTEADDLPANKTDYELGFRFEAGNSVFEPFEETFDFTIRSREWDTEGVSYKVKVTRPAREVIMPGPNAFTDVTYEAGTTGYQFVSIETADTINANVLMSGEAQDAYASFCYEKGTYFRCNAGVSPNYGGEATFGVGVDRFGIYFSLPSNQYVEFDQTVVFKLASTVDETKTVDYAVRLYRPAAELKLPPADFFTDIEFPAGTTGSEHVMKDLAGHINTNMQMWNERENESYYLCRNYEGRTSPYCPTSTDGRYSRAMDFYPTDSQVGFRVPLPSNKFQPYENTFNFSLISKELSSARRDYSVQISRPAAEIFVPPATLFSDVKIPAGTKGYHYEMKPLDGIINTNMTMSAPPQEPDTYLCHDREGRTSPSCSYYTDWRYAKAQNFSPADSHIGFRVTLPSNIFQEFERNFTFDLVSQENSSKRQSYTVNIHRPRSEIKLPPEDFFTDVEVPAGTKGYHYVMKALEGHITTEMEMYTPPQEPDTYLCYDSEGRTSPSCSYRTDWRYPATQAFSPANSHVGFRMTMPSNVYHPFEKTVTFDLVSVEDRSMKRTYTVRVYRPAVEVQMPPADYFTDVQVPAGTTGYHYVMKELAGVINTSMTMNAPAQAPGTYLCYDREGRSSPYCYYVTHAQYPASQAFSPADSHVGFRMTMPSDVFQPFEREFTFELQSTENTAYRQSYTVKVTRPAKEVEMPSAALFQDVVIPAGTTGAYTVMGDVSGLDASRMRVFMPKGQSYNFYACVVNSGTSEICSTSGTVSSDSTRDSEAGRQKLGFKVNLPSNRFAVFDHMVELQIHSLEQPEKVQTYNFRITRERSEITMPAANLFEDVTLASTKTGWNEIAKSLDEHVNTSVRIDMQPTGVPVEICYTEQRSSTVRCSWDARDSARSVVYDPDDWDKLGFKIYTGGNEFQPFESTVNFTLTSIEDETKTVSYSVKVTRPRSEIAMPSANLFEDVTLASTKTGWNEVVKSLDEHVTTKVRIDMQPTGVPVEICYTEQRSSTVRCSWDARDSARSVVYDPDDWDKLGFKIYTGGNEFQPFESTVNFTLTSVEDETKTVSYSVKVKRPRSEIKAPPADLFTDVSFTSTQTGIREISKNLDSHVTTKMRIDVQPTSYYAEGCYTEQGDYHQRCYGSIRDTARSWVFDPDDHREIGFKIFTGDNEFQPFAGDLTFSVTSVEDETVTQSYTIQIDRSRSQIAMPPADFFGDITLASTATGWRDVQKRLQDVVNTKIRFDMPAQGFNAKPCYSSDSTSALSCGNDAKNDAQVVNFDEDSHDDIGFSVFAGSNEFQPFDETLTFSLTSVEDEAATVNYSVRVQRPKTAVRMPSADLFPDMNYGSSQTGWQSTQRSILNAINTKVRVDMPAQGHNVELCFSSRSTSGLSCYGNAKDVEISREFDRNNYDDVGFRVHTGADASQPFDEVVSFTLTSVEDETATVTYTIPVHRAAAP
jgi:rRNA processing protein Krr1/Pno1